MEFFFKEKITQKMKCLQSAIWLLIDNNRSKTDSYEWSYEQFICIFESKHFSDICILLLKKKYILYKKRILYF